VSEANNFCATTKTGWLAKISIGLSFSLVSAWASYTVYVMTTRVDKQSVYVGPITVWTADLLVFCVVVVLVNVVCLLAAWRTRATGRKLANRAMGFAVFLAFLMFYISNRVINMRMIDG
jgi:hypothetical protein